MYWLPQDKKPGSVVKKKRGKLKVLQTTKLFRPGVTISGKRIVESKMVMEQRYGTIQTKPVDD